MTLTLATPPEAGWVEDKKPLPHRSCKRCALGQFNENCYRCGRPTTVAAYQPVPGTLGAEQCAACPTCGTHSKVREHITQATRQEPSRSLGDHGYCPSCDCSFKVVR